METVKLKVSGRVQGVGFRYTTTSLAQRMQLTGTVQNLSNGTVEIILQSSTNQREQFIKALRDKKTNPSARVDDIVMSDPFDASAYSNFKIIY